MALHVLGVGYSYDEYGITAANWKNHDIEFDYADSIRHAAAMLAFKEYISVAICTDVILQEDLDALRNVRPVPIIVVPPSYTEEQRYACVHFGAAQYLHTYKHPLANATTAQNGLKNYLEIPANQRKPLTVITVKDLSFCLEYRTVEIAGTQIELTEKEFDILALLIMNQRQVFTHEMIMEAVWHEDFAFFSRNALSSHISNLRKKLRAVAISADHIHNIYGVGYKFDA